MYVYQHSRHPRTGPQLTLVVRGWGTCTRDRQAVMFAALRVMIWRGDQELPFVACVEALWPPVTVSSNICRTSTCTTIRHCIVYIEKNS